MHTSNVSLGYKGFGNTVEQVAYYDIAAMNPAGGINTTAHDMANWLLTWINKGRYEKEQVLPEQYVMAAMNPLAVLPKGYLPDEEFAGMYPASYGYGWMTPDYKGHYRVEYGGSIDGFRSTVAFFSNEKVGVVALTNQNGYEAAMMIRNTLVDIILDSKKTDWIRFYSQNQAASQSEPKAPATPAAAATPAANTTQDFNQYIGSYSNLGYGTLKLFYEGGSLYTYFRRRKLRVVPTATNQNIFYATSIDYPYDRAMPPLHFKKDEKGTITSLSIKFEPELEAIEFSRQ